MRSGRNYKHSYEVKMGKVIVMTTDDAEFFSKISIDLQTFNLMEDELRKIISTDYHNGWNEDQRDLK
jgi:hypothetical protein